MREVHNSSKSTSASERFVTELTDEQVKMVSGAGPIREDEIPDGCSGTYYAYDDVHCDS